MPRKEYRDKLQLWLEEHRLDDVYGCIAGEKTAKNNPHAVICYTVTFCKSSITDGEISVYKADVNKYNVVVRWQTANRTLPHEGRKSFVSEESLFEFLEKFV